MFFADRFLRFPGVFIDADDLILRHEKDSPLKQSAVAALIRLTGSTHTHSLHKSAIGGQHRAFRLRLFLLDLVLAGSRYMPFAQETIARTLPPG